MTARFPADPAALLAAIVESSNDAIIGKGLDGTIWSWNRAAERIFGYSAGEMVGTSIRRLIPADRQQEEDAILASVGRGEIVPMLETVRLRKDGGEVIVAVTVSPVRDAEGRIVAASKIARDVTAMRNAEQRIELLLMEVNHRAKNMLAMIQSLARRTVASGGDYVARLEQRVASLAASQDLLVNRAWSRIPVAELVDVQLRFLGDALLRQVAARGVDVALSPGAAEAIGMALHEMATNAIKYGALSVPAGRVVLEWGVEEEVAGRESRFWMDWREESGPEVTAPESLGFGSRIIADVPRSKLDGVVTVDFAPAGFHWRLECPAGKSVTPV